MNEASSGLGGIWHVLSRGVDKRRIVMDDKDKLRFVHDLFEFNDQQPINNITYNFKVIARPYIGGEAKKRRPRKLLVEILAFCLMPNHYHLLLVPKAEGGITKFMKRLNMGYARYFNEKYERSGALFEGRYKRIPINNYSHFVHLPYYIHCNPLDIVMPEWRERKLESPEKALEFLENYRWSSFPDYIGRKNFPSVTQRGLLLKFSGGEKEYRKETLKWLKDMNLEMLVDTTLEN